MSNQPLPLLSGLTADTNIETCIQSEMQRILQDGAIERVDYLNLIDNLFERFVNKPSDVHFESIYKYMSETYPHWVSWYDKHSFAELYQVEVRYQYANFTLENDYRTNLQKKHDKEIEGIVDAWKDRTRIFNDSSLDEFLKRCVNLKKSIATEPGKPYRGIRLLRLTRIILDVKEHIEIHTQHSLTHGPGAVQTQAPISCGKYVPVGDCPHKRQLQGIMERIKNRNGIITETDIFQIIDLVSEILGHKKSNTRTPPDEGVFEQIYEYLTKNYPTWRYDKYSFSRLYVELVNFEGKKIDSDEASKFNFETDFRSTAQRNHDDVIEKIETTLQDYNQMFDENRSGNLPYLPYEMGVYLTNLEVLCVKVMKGVDSEEKGNYRKERVNKIHTLTNEVQRLRDEFKERQRYELVEMKNAA